jgi:hypothetical protein
MEPYTTGSGTLELVVCPEPGCRVPAEVVDRFLLVSTHGSVAQARTWCLDGHGFTQRPEALVAWPVAPDRRPLDTGGGSGANCS